MAVNVVLDANVLYPFSLRDTLLRLAERELYVLAWSERILDEVSRNVVRNGHADEITAARLLAAMRAAFPEALVDADAVAATEPTMTNDPDDRHVLATAVVSGAEGIVTFNARHFRPPHLLTSASSGSIPTTSSARCSTSTTRPSPTP